jgi:hypothetical protein
MYDPNIHLPPPPLKPSSESSRNFVEWHRKLEEKRQRNIKLIKCFGIALVVTIAIIIYFFFREEVIDSIPSLIVTAIIGTLGIVHIVWVASFWPRKFEGEKVESYELAALCILGGIIPVLSFILLLGIVSGIKELFKGIPAWVLIGTFILGVAGTCYGIFSIYSHLKYGLPWIAFFGLEFIITCAAGGWTNLNQD